MKVRLTIEYGIKRIRKETKSKVLTELTVCVLTKNG